MRSRILVASCFLFALLSACGGNQQGSPSEPGAIGSIDYPDTRRLDLTSAQTGTVEPDPYAWLDIAIGAAPDVAAWAAQQHQLAEDVLTAAAVEGLNDDLITRANTWGPILPEMRDSVLLYLTSDAGTGAISVMEAAPDGTDPTERLRLPGNLGTTLSWQSSMDGRFASFLQQTSDGTDLLIADLQAGRLLRDTLPASSDSQVLWHPSADRIFYTVWTSPGVFALKEHRLGAPASLDRVIIERNEVPSVLAELHLIGAGGLLALTLADPTTNATSMVGHVFETGDTIEPLMPIDGHAFLLGETEEGLFWFVRTEERSRVLRIELSKPMPRDWQELLSFPALQAVDRAAFTGRSLLTVSSGGPSSALTVYTADGQLQGSFDVPHGMVVTHIGTDDDQGFVTLQFADVVGRRVTQVANLQTISQTTIHETPGATSTQFVGDVLSAYSSNQDCSGDTLVLLTDNPGRDLASGFPVLAADHVARDGCAVMLMIPIAEPFPERLATLTDQDDLYAIIKQEMRRLHQGPSDRLKLYAPGWAGSIALALSVEQEPVFSAFVAENPLTDYLSPVVPGLVPSTEQATRLELSPYARFMQAEPMPAALMLVESKARANANSHAFKFTARRQYRAPDSTSLLLINPLHRAPVPSPAMVDALARQQAFLMGAAAQ